MKPSINAHLHTAADTHPGMRGKNNEDRFSIKAYTLDKPHDMPALFAIVADGVGGHQAGDVAAELAVNVITHEILSSDGSDPLKDLENSVQLANQRIYEQANRQMEQYGMGSTCVCVWIIGDRLYSVSIGDSRLYLIRNGEILQLTTDHTWVQEALEKGILTPSQAQNHPRSNIIRRYLGSPEYVEPDFRLRLSDGEDDQTAEANQGMTLQVDDILILCSDGLSDLVEAHEIKASFEAVSLESAIDNLITLANRRGGHDNITITAMKAPGNIRTWGPSGEKSWLQRLPVWVPISCLGGVLLTIAAIVIGIVFLLQGDNTQKPNPTTIIIPAAVTSSPALSPTPSSSTKRTPTPIPTTTPQLATYTPWPTSTPGSSP